jgi:hypothetical protein
MIMKGGFTHLIGKKRTYNSFITEIEKRQLFL